MFFLHQKKKNYIQYLSFHNKNLQNNLELKIYVYFNTNTFNNHFINRVNKSTLTRYEKNRVNLD